MDDPRLRPQSRAILAGRSPSRLTNVINPPVQRGSTVVLDRLDQFWDPGGRTYGRAGLAAQEALSEALLSVCGGAGAILAPSGLAACTLAILSFAKAGGHILAPESAYGPTRSFCGGVLQRFGVHTTFYNPRIGADIASLIRPETTAIYLESPGSLTFEVQDAPAIAAAARARGIVTMIDDTWSAGVHFKPFEHGVDVSIQALTKHQGGHADLLLGAVIANRPEHAAQIEATARQLGMAVGPEDSYLALRGMRTLHLRLNAQGESGLRVADWLSQRSEVSEVLHPALPRHPDHALWLRDFSGACGVFGALLQPCSTPALAAMVEGYRLFRMGYSWGGFESLVSCAPRKGRFAERPLIRFSVGLEAVEDLLLDLEEGFARLQEAA